MVNKKRTVSEKGNKNSISRRGFIGASAGVAAASTIAGFPSIVTATNPVRAIGLGVSCINEIQGQAGKDLGFPVKGQALGYGAMFGKMLNQNDQYEVAEGYFNDFDVMVPAKIWQPIDTKRLPEWDKVSSLSKTGKLNPDSSEGDGDAPFRKLWCDADGNLVKGPSRYITAVPIHHNADSLGYNREELGGELTSWGQLFSEKSKGAIALVNVPQIGVMDAAMAYEAISGTKFKDKGDLTKAEIDVLMDFLIEKKKDGYFRAFWETFGQSVNLMVSGEVIVQSMWSPAVSAAKAEGIDCVYASPKEGMRGWHGCAAISAKLKGKALDQAYEYVNWWLNGWAGAFQGRMGYYHSIPENVKKHMTPEEWDFWYLGKPAAKELNDPWGNPVITKGAVRDGGSYADRFRNIAVWNSLMKENDYLVKRWTEFLTAS